jgi:hemoglobin-like flavoprotein
MMNRLRNYFKKRKSDSAVAKKAAELNNSRGSRSGGSEPSRKNKVPPSPNNSHKKEKKAVARSNLDCSQRIPADSISFQMVNTVINSWENKVKKIPNWLPIAGELLLRKMFELDPETITMFGLPADTRFNDPELKNNKHFMAKGMRLVQAVDTAIKFLGPDLEPLEDTLVELGTRHVARHCRPHHWPVVGDALFYVFEVGLGDQFTDEIREAWTIMYNFLGYHMIQGLLKQCPALEEPPLYPAPAHTKV